MSLNTISLTTNQVDEWYGQHLIASPKQAVVPADWTVLGDFKKSILILIDEPEQAFLRDEDLSFLTGILAACKLNMGDVGIVNLTSDSITRATDLEKRFHPSSWWLFGLDMVQKGFNGLEPGGRYKNAPVFAAPALRVLAQNPEAKKILWNQLKSHFGV